MKDLQFFLSVCAIMRMHAKGIKYQPIHRKFCMPDGLGCAWFDHTAKGFQCFTSEFYALIRFRKIAVTLLS